MASNKATSIKQQLLNLARKESRIHEIILVRYALERLLYRLSISHHRDRFILKGGMLMTLWIEGGNRETRDADFLGYGDATEESLKATFFEIMAIEANDGIVFDTEGLTATNIREEMEYGGFRLRTTAYMDQTRIPVTIDIGFGDAIAAGAQSFTYPSLLAMETPIIRAYPPQSVIAEKFQAMVALGVANGRMKDYFDLWAIAKSISITNSNLDAAIVATFERRNTEVPKERPPGLSESMFEDSAKQVQWRAYAKSIDIAEDVTLEGAINAAWELVGPACERIHTSRSGSCKATLYE